MCMHEFPNLQGSCDCILLLSTKLNKCFCGLVVTVYMLNKPKKVPFHNFTKTENERDHKSGCLKLLLARGLNHCDFYSLFTDKDITNGLPYHNKVTC